MLKKLIFKVKINHQDSYKKEIKRDNEFEKTKYNNCTATHPNGDNLD